jgi:hypothetical protein
MDDIATETSPFLENRMTKRRGMIYLAGMLFAAGPLATWVFSSMPTTPPQSVVVPVEQVQEADATTTPDLAELAKRDPMALVRKGVAWFEENVKEYRTVLVKQELLGKELSDVQEVEVRVRQNPLSVYMVWLKNADQAKRALWIDTADFVNSAGEKTSLVEPAGAVARLFVSQVEIPIHGARAKKASRRTIDECGFHATFRLFEMYNELAAERGDLKLSYGGTGKVDGRPTYVITRELPYTGPDGPYPDARLVMHLDQEWLLPVAVYSYADQDEKLLLGRYVFTDVELNPDFDGDAFKF